MNNAILDFFFLKLFCILEVLSKYLNSFLFPLFSIFLDFISQDQEFFLKILDLEYQ